jgi:hypothetical protein
MASNEPDSNSTKTPEKSSLSMQQCYENYVIIDVGANLTNKKYGRDLDSVIQRAKDAGMCLSILRRNCVAFRILSEVWVMCWLYCSRHLFSSTVILFVVCTGLR